MKSAVARLQAMGMFQTTAESYGQWNSHDRGRDGTATVISGSRPSPLLGRPFLQRARDDHDILIVSTTSP